MSFVNKYVSLIAMLTMQNEYRYDKKKKNLSISNMQNCGYLKLHRTDNVMVNYLENALCDGDMGGTEKAL